MQYRVVYKHRYTGTREAMVITATSPSHAFALAYDSLSQQGLVVDTHCDDVQGCGVIEREVRCYGVPDPMFGTVLIYCINEHEIR